MSERMRRSRRLVVEAVEARVLMSAAVPAGPETRVNEYTPGYQSNANLASDSAGNYVVTWVDGSWSANANGLDGSLDGIFARLYAADGTPRSPQFQVNSHTAGSQQQPAAAMDAGGNFVVVWQSQGQDGDGYGVYARLFDAAGARVGGEFLVNTRTAGSQVAPSVAMNEQGEFVVTWSSEPDAGGSVDVYAKRSTPAATPLPAPRNTPGAGMGSSV